jgi:ubiquinone/menaquinone biosynthesis C-methylase UbiE
VFAPPRASGRQRLGTLFAAIVLAIAAAPVLAQRTAAPTDLPPERIFAALGLQEGMTVGEIGAGSGELSVAAAKLVGAKGKVYTSELGEERVRALDKTIKSSGLEYITVVTGDPAATKFPDACCDAIFMRNVYHHFADPAAMNASIVRSLKSGGRLVVVDFTPPGQEAGQAADRGKDGMHGVSPESVARELEAAGLTVTDTVAGRDRWFMVVATKDRFHEIQPYHARVAAANARPISTRPVSRTITPCRSIHAAPAAAAMTAAGYVARSTRPTNSAA